MANRDISKVAWMLVLSKLTRRDKLTKTAPDITCNRFAKHSLDANGISLHVIENGSVAVSL